MPVVSIGPFEVAAGAFALLLALIAVSFLVEALRRAPRPPERLAWAPDTPVHYVDLDGVKVRFIKAGSGPNLVLLHTPRTQLDLFAKVVPDLAKAFTVYAIDYSGHGYSDIPPARYDAGFFARFVGRFLEALDLGEVTLCGVSIGGAVSLILAGRGHSRVARVIAVYPYDYANINVPVCLIWGDQDWCRPSERERHRAFIPGAQIVTVESAGRPSIVRTNYAS